MLNEEEDYIPDDERGFDESIHEEDEQKDQMFICSVCKKLLDPDWEQWICSSCFMSDSYAYKYAINEDSQPD
jgi:hypothetical protein